MSGKLIVFEGTDGSGKATQAKLLCDRMEKMGISFRKIDFPRYGKPSAAMVEEYLGGKLGAHPEDVNAYAASTFYAVDRYASYKQDWGGFYDSGGLVIADRYTTSNAVHQASKLPPEERKRYLQWLFDFEYRLMELPEPSLVLYLDLPTELSGQMMRHREQETGTQADIHEKDAAYLRSCRENARQVACDWGWRVIRCFDGERILRPEEIHEQVYEEVKKLLQGLS